MVCGEKGGRETGSHITQASPELFPAVVFLQLSAEILVMRHSSQAWLDLGCIRKVQSLGAEELDQWSKAQTTLEEDPSLVTTIYISTQLALTTLGGTRCPLLASLSNCMRPCTYKPTVIDIILIFFFKRMKEKHHPLLSIRPFNRH